MSKKFQTQKPSSLLGYDSAQQKVYIYAQVDIDKLYQEIVSKSKKVQKFLEEQSLDGDFVQKMRQYKHLKRICFDNEIQQYIFKKELNRQLKNVKKNVFCALEDFLIARFHSYLEEQALHKKYNQKVKEIELEFNQRIEDLTKNYL